MNNYQQRIHERAEQLYTRIFPIFSHSIALDNSPWNTELLNLAKLSVDAEAQAVRKVLKNRQTYTWTNQYLEDAGLIPPPETIEQGGGEGC